MRRFFVETIERDPAEIGITGTEFVHLKRVLRLKKGDAISVFDGRGLEFLCTIKSVGESSAVVRVDGRKEGVTESPLEITLIQALLKGDKEELVVQKATELGVRHLRIYPAERSVPERGPDRLQKRLKRWKKIAVTAAKQCGRTVVPDIKVLRDSSEALSGVSAGIRIALHIAFHDAGGEDLKGVLREAAGVTKAAVLIGPEGGLSDEEVSMARAAGFLPVVLGPRVLRAETASIAVVSILQHELGDFNRGG